jgi:hypothetical protein
MKVFVSHSTKDKEFVQRLAAALEEADFEPWLCEVDIDRGENFVARINEGLGESDLALLVWSPDAGKSAWTEQEWNSQLAQQVEEHKVRLGIILLRDYPLPPVLRTCNRIEARWDQAAGIRESLDWLRALRRHSVDERQRRERQKRVLDRVRRLLREREFAESVALAKRTLLDFPSDPEIRKLIELAELELKRQQHRVKAIGEVRKLIENNRFADALELIEDLSRVYPNDLELQTLETLVANGQREQAKGKRLEEIVSSVEIPPSTLPPAVPRPSPATAPAVRASTQKVDFTLTAPAAVAPKVPFELFVWGIEPAMNSMHERCLHARRGHSEFPSKRD